VAGLHGDAIKIRLKAPPVDGAANEELIRFVAHRLRIPRDAVQLAAGATGRRKRLRITGGGSTAEAIRDRLLRTDDRD
jgi:uncharacterized protein (TIGR00251 family)